MPSNYSGMYVGDRTDKDRKLYVLAYNFLSLSVPRTYPST